MSAREAILSALGSTSDAGSRPAAPPLYTGPAGHDETDLLARFAASLEAASGSLRALPASASLADTLRADPRVAAARRVWSALSEHPSRDPGARPSAPHELADLDVALLRGTLGVAESGAVWLAAQNPLERAALFLAEHVILVLPRRVLVPDLHAAYAQLDFSTSCFGCFVCGPSKTADIEQALVIGAHGPKSLEVWLTSS